MTGLLGQLQDFAGWIARGRTTMPEASLMPTELCLPSGCAGADIVRDRDYFHVSINELLLSNARTGWATYDPMVVVTTSFLYGGKRISVPAVVGPGLLETRGNALPQGILLQDTTVAGPYPYRGGPVAISLVFYKLRHRDYAKELLHLVESVWGAVGPAADMGILSKVGGALIEGLDKLVGMGETEAIAAHRTELSPLKPDGFRTCFVALIDGQASGPSEKRRVDCGRLETFKDGGWTRYSAANYVLYSITSSQRRDDERALSFYPLYERALADAARGGADAWKSAKATFGELWQQMILSPDLTKAEAAALFDIWRNELLEARDKGKNTKMMSMEGAPPEDLRIKGAAGVLDL